MSEALQMTGLNESQIEKALKKCEISLDLFPSGVPIIIEVMTSSTSGGNKKHRTTIPMAFEDFISGKSHAAPGINYRQVWARMVSQLIVKSEVGVQWKGRAYWILQDNLINYISKSTALNIQYFLSQNSNEVNIVGATYGDNYNKSTGPISMEKFELFAGPISKHNNNEMTFQDIIRTPVVPPKQVLMRQLLKKRVTGIVIA